MRKSILLLGVCFLLLASCAKSGGSVGKSVFDPNDVGQDLDSTEPGESPGVTPGTPPITSPDEEVPSFPIEPFPEDAKKFNKAWTRTDTALVLDCYQGSSINWDKVATDKRVAGVIHRATIGLRADLLYAKRKEITARHRYLWGAYHLGKSGDPIKQAQFYLDTIGGPTGDVDGILMVLDLEDVTNPEMMNIKNAQIFLAYVYKQTGRVPIVYANHTTTKALNKAMANDPYFTESRLWYARYRTEIPDFPEGIWPSYFLWQFSSYLNCSKTGSCLYNVPGTDRYIDVNVFYGSIEALKQQWFL